MSELILRISTDDVDSVVRDRFCVSRGAHISDYIRVFGYPEHIEMMTADPVWFVPPLPGLEEFSDYAVTVADAHDILEEKKRDAFISSMIKEGRYEEDTDSVLLSEAEYNTLREADSEYLLREIGLVSQDLYEDLLIELDTLVGRHSGEWLITGSNLDWRHSDGQAVKRLDSAADIIEYVDSYGGTLTLEQTEEERSRDAFRLICRHHDCPVNGTVITAEPHKGDD